MAIQYEKLRVELVEEFGLGRLSEEKQNELLDKMVEALMKKIMIVTMERLGESGMEDYDVFMQTDPEIESVNAYLLEKIPGYDEMIADAIVEFKKEMKGDAV